MSRCFVISWALLGLGAALSGQTAELLSVEVKREGKRYFVHSESRYAASREALQHILLDYDNFDRVSSVFKDTGYIESAADGTPRAYTRVEGCVLFFCQSIERIDQIFVTPESIVAESEPEPDDFRYSRGQWDFKTTEAGEVITYRLEMEPGFWVPPLIGPYILKKRLVDGAVEAMDRVEVLAIEYDNQPTE